MVLELAEKENRQGRRSSQIHNEEGELVEDGREGDEYGRKGGGNGNIVIYSQRRRGSRPEGEERKSKA
jgi:hypothetical protein